MYLCPPSCPLLTIPMQIFSALNGMLPSSMGYFVNGGVEKQKAGLIMMSCFVGGFLGIQAISRVLHRFMPSHVVDCDHSHDEPVDEHRASSHHRHRSTKNSRGRRHSMGKVSPPLPPMTDMNGSVTESTPLLPAEAERNGHLRPQLLTTTSDVATHPHGPLKDVRNLAATQSRTSSISQVQKRVMSFVKDTKANCDNLGPCFGYSDPCGQECFKHLALRSPANPRASTMIRPSTGSLRPGLFAAIPEDANYEPSTSPTTAAHRLSRVRSRSTMQVDSDECHSPACAHVDMDYRDDHDDASEDESQTSEDIEAQHHHHVPTNAFLSIGLQTVIALALHKFPEGFITYATNHASPALGFNVFMALFVHNIADGFAMALPLYMALGSRVKAIFWSSLLGGLSQPIGAAIAVLWFKLANRSDVEIDNVAYACMFAVTAGIMASVALQLFVESLSLNHNRNLNTFFAFLGMAILGLSNTIVEH